MEQFDKVKAIFKPKRTDDLNQWVKLNIGDECIFQASWIIEEGEYKNQWAMSPDLSNENINNWNFAWCPECDLDIIEKL